MDADHPYRPPDADLGGAPAALVGGDQARISHGIVEILTKTRPWVLFMGVMILLGCGLMVFAGLAMLVVGGIAGMGSELGPAGGMLIGAVYLVMALLYLFPALYLLRFSGAIKRVGSEPTAEAIELALRHQFGFWRFVGIVAIATIAAYVLLMVIFVIFAVANAG